MMAEVGDMLKVERQQDRHAVGAAQPGQHADDHAQHDADHHVEQVLPAQHDGEAVHQVANTFHRSPIP